MTRRPHLHLARLGVVIFGCSWLPSCTVAVEMGSLEAGETEADCASWQKLCPYEGEVGTDVLECVDATSPQRGCKTESCEACQVAGAVPRCTHSGACGIAICQEGYEDCDRNEATGCEVSLLLDEKNCGACGRECTTENGVANCIEGSCEIVFCKPPYADCEKDVPGCETNTDQSTAHCGECNEGCDGQCVGGACEE